MLPRPVQRPRIPIWFGTRGSARPVRRAARYDGIYPIDVTPDDLARIVALVGETRGNLDDFDIAISVTPKLRLEDYARYGVSWAMHSFWPTHQPDAVLRFVAKSPQT